MAAETGGTHVTRVMLLCGAKKSIWDDKGKTPFDYAVRMGRPSTVESILVFRAASMNSRQNINFLFHKMLADGEHKEKRLMTVRERRMDDAGDAARETATKGLKLLKWGANMVKSRIRIIDGAARGESETPKMKAEREAREKELNKEGGTVGRAAKKTWGKVAMAVKTTGLFGGKEKIDLDAVDDGLAEFGLE